jgi:uncharacterized membrane protein required for colicin V production
VRFRDRALGIFLGILLGLAVIILFLFLGSRETIDSPDISGDVTQEQTMTTTAPVPQTEPGGP